jgi:hypothetical protein
LPFDPKETAMSNVTTVVDDYIAAWNARDAQQRRDLVQRAFADDATYLDPARSGSGLQDIAEMIGTAQEHFPGHRVELVGAADAHNDRVRFTWQLFPPEGEPILTGYDFATVADDGRLRDVTGFAEPIAAP